MTVADVLFQYEARLGELQLAATQARSHSAIAAAALAQHAVALFYVATPRYHFLAWFLTLLVGVVWLRERGVGWFQRRYPNIGRRIAAAPLSLRLVAGLSRLETVSS